MSRATSDRRLWFHEWEQHWRHECCDGNNYESSYIDFHYDDDLKTWKLSEYEDFGKYYLIKFCPWCGIELPRPPVTPKGGDGE